MHHDGDDRAPSYRPISRRKTLTIASLARDPDATDYFPRPLPKSDYCICASLNLVAIPPYHLERSSITGSLLKERTNKLNANVAK